MTVISRKTNETTIEVRVGGDEISTDTTVKFLDLPPGLYRVTSWHPRLPGTSTDVTLTADKTAKMTVSVGVNSLPKVP